MSSCVAAIGVECDLLVRLGDEELRLDVRVASIEPGLGVRLQLTGDGRDLQRNLAALARLAGASAPTTTTGGGAAPATEDAADAVATADEETAAERRLARNVHERLRNLPVAEQLRLAHKGELHERIVLERMYGKTVWEALLRNPKLTGPEVARIARMGALPRPLLEIIVGNGGWLQIPEVRRALLANPRLALDQIVRVLRLLPKHELKLTAIQTAYPFTVRDTARRVLREE